MIVWFLLSVHIICASEHVYFRTGTNLRGSATKDQRSLMNMRRSFFLKYLRFPAFRDLKGEKRQACQESVTFF